MILLSHTEVLQLWNTCVIISLVAESQYNIVYSLLQKKQVRSHCILKFPHV